MNAQRRLCFSSVAFVSPEAQSHGSFAVWTLHQNVYRHNSNVEDDVTKNNESDVDDDAEEDSAEEKAEKARLKRQNESTWKLAALEVRLVTMERVLRFVFL
jgi:hypothetical protein